MKEWLYRLGTCIHCRLQCAAQHYTFTIRNSLKSIAIDDVISCVSICRTQAQYVNNSSSSTSSSSSSHPFHFRWSPQTVMSHSIWFWNIHRYLVVRTSRFSFTSGTHKMRWKTIQNVRLKFISKSVPQTCCCDSWVNGWLHSKINSISKSEAREKKSRRKRYLHTNEIEKECLIFYHEISLQQP